LGQSASARGETKGSAMRWIGGGMVAVAGFGAAISCNHGGCTKYSDGMVLFGGAIVGGGMLFVSGVLSGVEPLAYPERPYSNPHPCTAGPGAPDGSPGKCN
jgi:hypothetical protein